MRLKLAVECEEQQLSGGSAFAGWDAKGLCVQVHMARRKSAVGELLGFKRPAFRRYRGRGALRGPLHDDERAHVIGRLTWLSKR